MSSKFSKIPHLHGGSRLTSCESICCARSNKWSPGLRRTAMGYRTSLKIVTDIHRFRSPFTIPEIPLVSPLIPSDIEFMDVDSFFGKHESDVFREHTVVRIAMHDNAFILRKLREGSDDTSFLWNCVFIIINSWNIDRSSDMFGLIFRNWPQINNNKIRSPLIHLDPEIMRTHRDRIFCRIVFEIGIWLFFDKWKSKSQNNKCTNNTSKEACKKWFHTIKK